eukprot:gene8005-9404_t
MEYKNFDQYCFYTHRLKQRSAPNFKTKLLELAKDSSSPIVVKLAQELFEASERYNEYFYSDKAKKLDALAGTDRVIKTDDALVEVCNILFNLGVWYLGYSEYLVSRASDTGVEEEIRMVIYDYLLKAAGIFSLLRETLVQHITVSSMDFSDVFLKALYLQALGQSQEITIGRAFKKLSKTSTILSLAVDTSKIFGEAHILLDGIENRVEARLYYLLGYLKFKQTLYLALSYDLMAFDQNATHKYGDAITSANKAKSCISYANSLIKPCVSVTLTAENLKKPVVILTKMINTDSERFERENTVIGYQQVPEELLPLPEGNRLAKLRPFTLPIINPLWDSKTISLFNVDKKLAESDVTPLSISSPVIASTNSKSSSTTKDTTTTATTSEAPAKPAATKKDGAIEKEVLKVIDAFSCPLFNFDQTKKQFVQCPLETSLHGDAKSKSDLFRRRYMTVLQRLERDKFFAPPILPNEKASKNYSTITPLNSLLGNPGKKYVLGTIAQIQEGEYYLQDLNTKVPINFADASIPYGLLTENSIVQVHGEFIEGVFVAEDISLPLAEKRSKSLEYLNGIDMFGEMPSDKVKEQLLLFEKEEPNNFLVFLSDVWLDSKVVMEKLNILFYGLQDMTPFAFVLMGNFTENPLIGGTQYKLRTYFDALAALILKYPNLQKSKFIFVPGPTDPTGSLLSILPKEPISDVFVKGFMSRVPNKDIVSKNLMIQISISLNINLPLEVRPVFWNYDHALSLYPLPDVMVLGDKYTQYVHDVQEGTKCFNPSSFSTDFSFSNYTPSTGECDFCRVPDSIDDINAIGEEMAIDEEEMAVEEEEEEIGEKVEQQEEEDVKMEDGTETKVEEEEEEVEEAAEEEEEEEEVEEEVEEEEEEEEEEEAVEEEVEEEEEEEEQVNEGVYVSEDESEISDINNMSDGSILDDQDSDSNVEEEEEEEEVAKGLPTNKRTSIGAVKTAEPVEDDFEFNFD